MQKSFRVLFLIENVPYSLDTRVRREAHALQAAGGKVTIICPSDGSGWTKKIDGIRVYQYPKPSMGQGFFAHTVEYIVSLFFHSLLTIWTAFRHGFEVIHVANPPDLLWLVALPYKLFGKQFVFDHHDLVPELYSVRFGARLPFLSVIMRLFEWCSMRYADHVISTNETFRRIAIERGGKPQDQVSVVRNGPWLARDFPILRGNNTRQTNKIIIGYLGIMNPQDHLDHLIAAARIIRMEACREDIEFILIGSGDAYPQLRGLRDSMGLSDCVSMPGTLPWNDVITLLSTADICVQPDPPTLFNRHLTMNKLMEYMALGKAVIAYDMPETRYSGGESVHYIQDETPLALANAITELADDSERRSQLGKLARLRVENVLAWEHQACSLLRVYRQLLPGRLNDNAVDFL
jgi:glycosyltransferase involved in cell wall biosynthesis